jgi:N,N'-diacetylchitobiose transport system permease protein
MMAGSTMMAIPVVILFLIVQRKMAAGLTAGAVKG